MKANRRFRWLPAMLPGCLLAAAAHADGGVTFGGQWWTQSAPEAFYQQYRDLPQGAFLESFVLREHAGKDYLRISGVNAMRRDQRTDFAWARGRLWLDLGYQEVPHLYSLIARTPYLEGAAGVFRLPDSLQSTNQRLPSHYDSTMADLLRNAAPRTPLDLETRTARERLRARPADGWTVDVRGVQRLRDGSRPLGGAFGFNSAIELSAPVRDRTDDVDATADYHRGRLSLEASGGASWYINDLDRVVWDNPKRLTDATSPSAYVNGDGSAQGQSALPPDDQVIRGALGLGLQLPQRTSLTANLGVARSTQNEPWLQYTINSAILQPDSARFALPGRSPDAKATTWSFDGRLVSYALEKLTGTLRFDHYRYDNQTPIHVFPGEVRLDQTWEAETLSTDRFGHARTDAGVDLDLQATRRLRLGASYDWLQRHHDDREVEKDTENLFTVRARLRPIPGFEIFGSYHRGDRRPNAVLEADLEGEQPLLRRFDVAGRREDDGVAGFSWMPLEKLDLVASWRQVHDDFDGSALGLQDARQNLVNAEGTWHFSETLDLTQGFGWVRLDSRQRSVTSGATLANPDSAWWSATLRDEDVYLFGNADWQAGRRIALVAGYEVGRSPGSYRLANVQGTARDLPGTVYRRYDVTTEARYQWTANLDLAARWAWEEYDVRDFANQDVALQQLSATASGGVFTNAIYLGDSSLSYHAHRLALVARYRF